MNTSTMNTPRHSAPIAANIVTAQPSRRAACAVRPTPLAAAAALLLAWPLVSQAQEAPQARSPQAREGRPDREGMLGVVRVRAAREEVVKRIEAPNPVVVIGREEIEKTNDLTLGDFLRRQPGVSFTGPAGNIKDIRMRGLDKGYTQILVDGEPWLGSTKERQIQVDQLPMSMVERVEIIRSPLPDMPAEGIGGTINIVLRRANADELNVKLGTGALWFDGHRRPQTSLQVNYARIWDNGLSLALPFNYNHRHEVKTKPKVVEAFDAGTGALTSRSEELEFEDNRVREITLGPRLTWRPDARDTWTLHGFFNHNDGDKHKTKDAWTFDDPYYVYGGRTVEAEDKDRSSLMLGGQGQRRLSEDMTGTVGLGSQRAAEDKHKPAWTYDSSGVPGSTSQEDSTVRAHSHKAYGSLRWQATPDHRLNGGVELRLDDRADRKEKNGTVQAGLGDRFDVEEHTTTVFLRDDWQVAADHLLVPGFRWEQRRTESQAGDGSQRSGSNAAFNPSLSYRWSLQRQWRLRLAAAQTLRSPKFENLTSATTGGDGTVSTSPITTGNPDLKPERSRGFDIGVEHDFFGRTGWASLNYTQRLITDAMEKRTVQDDDGLYYNRPYNVDGVSRTRAIEADTRFDLRPLGLRDLTLLGNYSRFFSRKAGSSDPLGDQPHYVANLGMDWRVASLRTLFGWRYNYQGRIYKSAGEYESSQRLVDAFAYWDIDRTWSLRVSASNLLDTKKTKYKPTYDSSTGALTGLTREQESGARGLLFTLEARL